MKETPTDIEQVLRKIVWETFTKWVGSCEHINQLPVDIVHALLNSEEVEILDKRDVKVVGEPFRGKE